MTHKPVIFLAFANDRVDETAYLRNLPKELDGIRKALSQAQQAGLCEVVERSNLTIEQLLDVFQDPHYKDRIAIFHYGGHANGYQLLLEAHDGSHASAHSGGLISFLSSQSSLKLVFLNGCSSQQQALELIESGVSSVIGTSQSINDDVAMALSIRFYKALGGGAAIEKAWEEAIAEAKIKKGTANMRDFYWDGMEESSPTKETNLIQDIFPWDIYFKNGAELTKKWNLPEAVDNPLFGLPPIPPKFHLPEMPFRYLQRYKRQQAEVFFGRSYYIRELFNLITDPNSSPLILLYGQSGVGKSSLLDAGVNPRLEETHIVWYMRRDQGISVSDLFERATYLKNELLSSQMADASPKTESPQIGSDQHEQEIEQFYEQLELVSQQFNGKLPPEIQEMFERMKIELHAGKSSIVHKEHFAPNAENPDWANLSLEEVHELPLIDQWRLLEQATGKPLVIIVDQLETIFTVPDPNKPDEFDELVMDLKEMFANPENLPKGKLILSYRKEFHPEIDEKFKQAQIPRSRLFLQHLKQKDITEVVTGLSKTVRTRQQYHLEVESDLPIIIADDLLEDKESPIAPVLQILLTKMWQMTDEDGGDKRTFTVEKYQQLRQEGILMDDFYEQQMEKLKDWKPLVVESGFALDVMMFHASGMMTADVRSQEELYTEYSENLDMIEELLQHMKELYLISSVNQGNLNLTTLAHDTLAPIVYKHYRSSDYPGQRARRILENKVPNFDPSDLKTSLDMADLEIVETGYYGMRAWNDDERALVEASRKRRKKTLALQKVRKRSAVVAVLFILLAAIFASNEAYKATKAAENEKIARLDAEKAEDDAKRKELEAIEAQKIAAKAADNEKVARLDAEASEKKAKDNERLAKANEKLAKDNEKTAIEALELAERRRVEADSAKDIALANEEKARKAKEYEEEAKEDAEKNATIANSRKEVARAKELALKSIQISGSPLDAEMSGLMALKAFADMNKYGEKNAKQDPDIYDALRTAWNNLNPEKNVASNLGETQSLSFSPNHKWLAGGGTSGQLRVWQNIYQNNYKEFSFCFSNSCGVKHITFSPSSALMATAHEDYLVRVWDLQRAFEENNVLSKAFNLPNKGLELIGHEAIVKGVHFISENKLVSIDIQGNILFWDLQKISNKPTAKKRLNTLITHSVKHPTEPTLLIACEDGIIRKLDLETQEISEWTNLQEGKITSININHHGQWVAFGTVKGKLILTSFRNPNITKLTYQLHKSSISHIAFSKNNTLIGTASFDKSIRVFRLSELLNEGGDKPIISIKDKEWLHTITFSADESKLLFGGAGQKIHIYETDAKTIANKLEEQLKKLITDEETKIELLTELKGLLKSRDDHEDIVEMK